MKKEKAENSADVICAIFPEVVVRMPHAMPGKYRIRMVHFELHHEKGGKRI